MSTTYSDTFKSLNYPLVYCLTGSRTQMVAVAIENTVAVRATITVAAAAIGAEGLSDFFRPSVTNRGIDQLDTLITRTLYHLYIQVGSPIHGDMSHPF